MPLFFIEMGQGIIGGGDLRVRTTPLYSCTLIGGYDSRTGTGGAYHYPANSIGTADIKADMNKWILALNPTDVTLIFARNTSGMGGMGTEAKDKEMLLNWTRNKWGIVADKKAAVAAGVELVDGGINADRIKNLKGDFDEGSQIDVRDMQAGWIIGYPGFKLYGRNREKTG